MSSPASKRNRTFTARGKRSLSFQQIPAAMRAKIGEPEVISNPFDPSKNTYKSSVKNLKKSVALPEGEDVNSWLSDNGMFISLLLAHFFSGGSLSAVSDFYEQINMLKGEFGDLCTKETCPKCTASAEYQYFWVENEKPIEMSAHVYFNTVFAWLDKVMEDPTVFPDSAPYPKKFIETIKLVCRRMFRYYAHQYWHHYLEISKTGDEEKLNNNFKHFYMFCAEFSLLEEWEVEPLHALVPIIITEEDHTAKIAPKNDRRRRHTTLVANSPRKEKKKGCTIL